MSADGGPLPRYPVYIISKGRWQDNARLTARCLVKDRVPFRMVVEPQEARQYAEKVGEGRLLVLPFSNLGQGSIPARNWVWEHSLGEGHARHWILDDNMRQFYRRWQGERIPCDAGTALAVAEDFTDRYENVGLTGLNYKMFGYHDSGGKRGKPPFYLNTKVYSCILVLNALPHRWRGRYNEDADLCLQVLSAGWCTVLLNAFLVDKIATMTLKGGNTDHLYKGDGRLQMARSLERAWPGVVKVTRRFQRPQHWVDWDKFRQPLVRRKGVEVPGQRNEYGMRLVQVAPKVKSPSIRAMLDEARGAS